MEASSSHFPYLLNKHTLYVRLCLEHTSNFTRKERLQKGRLKASIPNEALERLKWLRLYGKWGCGRKEIQDGDHEGNEISSPTHHVPCSNTATTVCLEQKAGHRCFRTEGFARDSGKRRLEVESQVSVGGTRGRGASWFTWDNMETNSRKVTDQALGSQEGL